MNDQWQAVHTLTPPLVAFSAPYLGRLSNHPAQQSNCPAWRPLAIVAAAVLILVALGAPRSLQAEGAADEDEKESVAEDGWGPESGGLQCRIRVVAADVNDDSPDLTRTIEAYARGEDLTLAVELRNVGDKPITVLGSKGNTPFVGPHLFELTFTTKDGQPLPWAKCDALTNLVLLIEASAHELEPAKTLTLVLRPAKFNPPMDYQVPPGEYQVRVRYHVDQTLVEQIAKHWPDKTHAHAWSGEVLSSDIPFTVSADPAAPKPAKLVWGEAKDGLQAALELRPVNGPVPGDPAVTIPINTAFNVVLHVKNVSDKPVSFVSESWRQDDRLVVLNSAGEEQPVQGAWYTGLPIMVHWTLKPGEIAELDSAGLGVASDEAALRKLGQVLGKWIFVKPGKYTLRYTIPFGNVRMNGAPAAADWQGELVTGEVTRFVRARTEKEVAAEKARYFTGHVELAAKDGTPVSAGTLIVYTAEASTTIDVQAGPIDVPNVTPDPVTISVLAPGYEESIFAGVQLTRDQTKRLELTPAEPARFRLVADGQPVVGAKVRHFNTTADKASAGPYPMNGLQGPVHAVSAEDGSVVLASLQRVIPGYEDLGAAVYFFYIEAEGLAGQFIGPVRAGEELGDVQLTRPLEVRGEIHGTNEELAHFAAEWDQPFEQRTANPEAAWLYASSQALETNRDGDKLTFHLTGLRQGKLRIISNFSAGTHQVTHTYGRRDPGDSDVVVELDLTESLDKLIITPAGRQGN